jgi:hypothetical protein
MPKYRYEGNRHNTDGTTALIYLDSNGDYQSVGVTGVAELSESQYRGMSELFVLTLVEDKTVDEDKKGPEMVKNTNRTVAKPTDRA